MKIITKSILVYYLILMVAFSCNGCSKDNAVQERSFEELLNDVTDVIAVKHSGSILKNGIYYHSFSVIKSVRGNPTEESITVSHIGDSDNIRIDDIEKDVSNNEQFKKGCKYLLLIKRRADAFSETDNFELVEKSLIIPLDENETAYLNDNDSLIYGKPLKKYISKETQNAFSDKTLEAYVAELVKNNPLLIYDNGFIKETDVKSVISGSQYIFRISLEHEGIKSFNGDRTTYDCKIKLVYKGEFKESIVSVILPSDKVEIGKEYIVAVNLVADSHDLFKISSRNSIFSIEDEDLIREVLN